MENNSEIDEAFPYFGNEEGIEAIIIIKQNQESTGASSIQQEGKTLQVNETKSLSSRGVKPIEKFNNKISGAKPIFLILIVLAIVTYLVISNSLNNNQIKFEQDAQAKAIQDSLAAVNAVNAAMQAVQAVEPDSVIKDSNFELTVPPNYKYLNDVEMDWRDGELVVPQGMFWSIDMMYNYGGEPDAVKTVATNLCQRQVGKKTVDGVVGGGMFQGQHQSTTIDDYVYLTINDKDFYWDDLKTNYVGGKGFDMLKKFQIRKYGLPSGTNICFPSRENGGAPGYFTFLVSKYSANDSAALASQGNTIPDSVENMDMSSEAYTDIYVDSIRQIKEKVISNYYRDLEHKIFDAHSCFASNVLQYITKFNTTADEINSSLTSHYEEFVNEHFEIDPYSFYVFEDASGKVTYSGLYKCYRTSKQKYQTCNVECEVIFNDELKLTSYREAKIRNLKFTDKKDE